MDAQQSIQSAPNQMALFMEALEPREIERRYSFEEIALALWVTSGVKSHAAAWLRCSPNTITKRLAKNARLREVAAQAKEAKHDRCERIVNDPIDQPCIYCGRPVVGIPEYLEPCVARQKIGDDGREQRLAPNEIARERRLGRNDEVVADGRVVRSGPLGDLIKLGEDGHVILVNIDPTERRVLAFKVLQATNRGYTLDRDKPVEIDVSKIPEDRLPEIAERMERGETTDNSPELRELLLKRAS